MYRLYLGNRTIGGGGATSYTLTCSVGSFGFTGQDSTLKQSLQTLISSGSFVITGQDSGVIRGLNAALSNGSYTLDSNNLSFHQALSASLENNVFSVSGQDAYLKYAGNYFLDSGHFKLTGTGVNLNQQLIVELNRQGYGVTGFDAGIILSLKLSLNSSNFNINWQNISLRQAILSALNSGDYAIIGNHALISKGMFTHPECGLYNLSGIAADIIYATIVDNFYGTSALFLSLSNGSDILITINGNESLIKELADASPMVMGLFGTSRLHELFSGQAANALNTTHGVGSEMKTELSLTSKLN